MFRRYGFAGGVPDEILVGRELPGVENEPVRHMPSGATLLIRFPANFSSLPPECRRPDELTPVVFRRVKCLGNILGSILVTYQRGQS